MGHIDLPRRPSDLVIAPDGDTAGRKAANTLRLRISLMPAPEGQDWNDVLKKRGGCMNISTPKTHTFNPGADRPEPDMTVIRPERPAAPEIRDQDFKAVFGPWADGIGDAAEVKNAPRDFVALGLLATASAIVGNAGDSGQRRRRRPSNHPDQRSARESCLPLRRRTSATSCLQGLWRGFLPKELRAGSRIAEIILADGKRQISTREIQRREMAGLQSAREIARAFAALEAAGWISQIQQPPGLGRPAKIYTVNPQLEKMK